MTDRPGFVSPLPSISQLLADAHAPVDPGAWLRALVDHGHDQLPLPGGGDTLARWQVLARVAAADLSLAKLFEGHTDALAILAELAAPAGEPRARLWGVWCAEPPGHRLAIMPGPAGSAMLRGTKAWCSGAGALTHALVSGWNPAGEPCLAAVALNQPGVTITDQGWHAVGMRASGSVDVVFDNASATWVGPPGAYVHRPGFFAWRRGRGGVLVRRNDPGGRYPACRTTRRFCGYASAGASGRNRRRHGAGARGAA